MPIYDLEGGSTIPNAHITEMSVYAVPKNGDTIKYSRPFLKSHSISINGGRNVDSSINNPESAVYHELEHFELKATLVGTCSA